jgi:2,5-diamino-6-(ribosylamino)-4(3H)-pyrimidinone 5'-phosphate reductase
MADTIPHVVAHVAVSLDGATTGFEPDIGRFYELAGTWREDVTLTGADTILAQEATLASAPRPGPAADGPLLAVVDSRARVTAWSALREVGYWRDVLALYSAQTSPRVGGTPELVTGSTRVDLAAALRELARRGAATVRVDSGGALTGALLAAGLVAEVSLLVHPVFAGPAGDHTWYGSDRPPAGALDLIAAESQPGGLVWLRYRVAAYS